MNILLIPLDERPVNIRYPQMIAAMAGASIIAPPRALLPDRKQPANRTDLLDWIKQTAPGCDACVLCVETLAYGGLIASRTGTEPAWEVLRWLDAALPYLPRPLYVSNVITRISRYDDAVEEPDYWAQHGSRLHAYSVAVATNPILAEELAAQIRAEHLRDFLTRRARNHAVNLVLLSGAEQFDLLVIPSDDTAPQGIQATERAALLTMREQLGLTERVLMYPGADEIGCTLTARLLNRGRAAPRVYVDYAVPGGAEITAKYEDRPVRETIAGQVQAVGAVLADDPDTADVVLLVNPPSATGQEWAEVDQEQERRTRADALRAGVDRAAQHMARGQRVAVADVAYPNGADPIFLDMLFDALPIRDLAAYGAWNTAGNTIGSVLAAACVPVTDDAARQHFLAHRFLEDWGYQLCVRTEMRAIYKEADPARLPELSREIAERLQAPLTTLRAHGLDYALSGVWLPWGRFFEVDFDLTAGS
jgi:hypothetical protein